MGIYAMHQTKVRTRETEIYITTLIGSLVNFALIVLKFLAGIFGHSAAMLADAVHSLSDFVTDIIVIIFVRIAGKPGDIGHDYGHGKYETFATLIIGFILAGVGVGLMVSGIEKVVLGLHGEIPARPASFALWIAIVSIITKEWLYRYTVVKGKKVDSQALRANAWHHRSDAFSSIGTLAGIAGSMYLGENFRILDPIAAILVSLFIIKSGYDIMKPCIGELLEASLPVEQEREIIATAESVPGIIRVHNLKTRRIGNIIAIDFHANMDGSQTLNEAHEIASNAEHAIRARFGASTIINIHMEPT